MPEGPPAWPCADEDVHAALESVYADGDWGRYHGRRCAQLVDKLSAYHRVDHVMLCSSGTVAVEIALRGLGVGPGDEVLLAGYDFSGNFRCIEAIGARPVLVDVDPKNWSLDPQQVIAALSDSTRAIIASHLHGGLVPMRELMEIAAEHDVAVVEDACQSPGAKVQGRLAGTWGDVGLLSFGGSKLLTAGRGGAILTSSEEVHQRAKVFCERGNQAFPMSELQAAVLAPQLDKLDERNKTRRENVRRLLDQLGDGEKGDRYILPERPEGCFAQNVPVPFFSGPAFYKLPWIYDANAAGGIDRQQFIAAVRAEGVALDVGFRGFTRRTLRRCRKVGPLEHSRRAAESTVLLHHPVLLEEPEVIDRVAAALRKVLWARK